MCIKSIFENLEGQWEFWRDIDDRYSRCQQSAKGGASFVKVTGQESPMMHYREDGTLTLRSGGMQPFCAEYRYILVDEAIQVIQKNGDHFVTLDVDNGLACDTHHCGADRYDAVFRFQDKDAFVVTYVVLGPRKDYTSQTRYFRLTAAP